MTGSKIGRYRITAFLGRGGMGDVYLALEDPPLSRPVALKFLPASRAKNSQRVQRFKEEAIATSRLNHPNILTVFEIGEDHGLHFIATEFVEGDTLRKRIGDHTVPLEDLLEIVIQVVNALAAAHGRGVIHRDLKPENIMLRPDGYVKLLDFGLARFAEEPSGNESATVSAGNDSDVINRFEGTPPYAAPEQILGRAVDGRADIFSLGVLMYEAATGRRPFRGDSPLELISSTLKDAPAPVRDLSPQVPREFEAIIHRALAKDRSDRYNNAEELLQDLKSFREKRQKRLVETPSLTSARASMKPERIDPAGGALPLSSRFYVVRSVDDQFRSALDRQDSIILIKGSHQVGKTSLLARGLQHARSAGASVVLTDFQKLNASDLTSCESLYRALAEMMADQIGVALDDEILNSPRGPNTSFERYLRRVVLPRVSTSLVWGMDEVDPLASCQFGSEVFGLFRSWHNERSLNPDGPWQRLTLVISYATEAHLFIKDVNQSPFVVGTPLPLEDFSQSQVEELNERYGAPLRDGEQIGRFFRLVGGHPYLVSCGLHSMAVHNMSVAELERQCNANGGPFATHLRHILGLLLRDQALSAAVKHVLEGKAPPHTHTFYHLRRTGLIAGGAKEDCRLRCELYADYLKRHLP